VFGYVIRRVESREEAEDITSEVFHQALANSKSFEWRGIPFSAGIGDAYLERGEAQGPYQPRPARFYLYVPDRDAVYRQALAAGASAISEPQDQPYGDRSGAVRDAFGHTWYIATHLKDVTS
jgi:uncharacterized glyoxalase superfamily protein PhnB